MGPGKRLALVAALAIAGCTRTDAPAPVSIYQEQPVPSAPGMITVARGENVYAIARRYNVPMREVIELNGLKPPYGLAVGQRLRLPTARFYTVKRGDTISSISRMHQVGMSELARTNGLKEPFAIKVGQQLQLPGGPSSTMVARAPAGDAGQPAPMGADRPPEAAPRPTVSARALPPPVVEPVPQPAPQPQYPPYTPRPGYGAVQSGPLPTPAPESVPAPPVLAAPVPAETVPAEPVPVRPVPEPAPGSQVAASEPPPAPAARPVPRVPVKPAQAAPAPPPPAAVTPPVAAARPPAIETPEPRSSGRFQWPVRGTILSEFGPKPGGLHNDGLNISAPKGSAVVAAENGVVAYAGNELRGFGNLLLIRHADGWMSAYAHLDEMLVDRGATVKRGQKIGTVGSTGNVSSPQLHFELRKSNRAMDPRDHLSGERRVSRDASPDGRPGPG
ncbi:peptidoglycan DD-metalloendopeptidase family protein [Skermanella mucosa]|uniref:peptidoglycan DD-metalloendopeptidase family protein n=1 Tax=Skermanella mucosa TaxID=1789672 RepID=UPI001E2929AD|nr:peptidoglycan DD-metalloendopeptidase family protein [Skermanella mucosa]UEM18765.1 peptidoglycan DD-metalloendopeptidase family protein [Skermanella mucosa]